MVADRVPFFPRGFGMAKLDSIAGVGIFIKDLKKAKHFYTRTIGLKVRDETSRRVYEAAKELGFHATSLIRQRIQADMPEIRLGFSLQRDSHPFYQAFAREIAKAAESTPGVRIRTYIEFAKQVTPAENVEVLEALGRRCQAIAMTSVDHHSVTKAVEVLRNQGKPVFSLLSDFAQGVREGYIGLNNMKVGRTAAWFISINLCLRDPESTLDATVAVES